MLEEVDSRAHRRIVIPACFADDAAHNLPNTATLLRPEEDRRKRTAFSRAPSGQGQEVRVVGQEYPLLSKGLCQEHGIVSTFVSTFLNGDNVHAAALERLDDGRVDMFVCVGAEHHLPSLVMCIAHKVRMLLQEPFYELRLFLTEAINLVAMIFIVSQCGIDLSQGKPGVDASSNFLGRVPPLIASRDDISNADAVFGNPRLSAHDAGRPHNMGVFGFRRRSLSVHWQYPA